MNRSLHHPYGGNLQHKPWLYIFMLVSFDTHMAHMKHNTKMLWEINLLGGLELQNKDSGSYSNLLFRHQFKAKCSAVSWAVEGKKKVQKRSNPLGICRTMRIIVPQIAALSHALLGHSTGLTSNTFKKGSRTFKRNNCSWQSPALSQSCMCSTSTSCWSRQILTLPSLGEQLLTQVSAY